MCYNVRHREHWEEWTAFDYEPWDGKFAVIIDCGPIGIPRYCRMAILETFDDLEAAKEAVHHYNRLNKDRFSLRKEEY